MMGIMMRIFKIIILSLGAFILLFLSLFFILPLDMVRSEQDVVFIEEIKSTLPIVNGHIKVSEFYPGKWDKVCMVYGGVASEDILPGVAEYAKIDVQKIKVTNRERSDSKYVADLYWILYFYTKPDKVELYRIGKGQILPRPKGFYVDDYGCVEHANAYFFTPQIKGKDLPERYYLGLTKSWPNN